MSERACVCVCVCVCVCEREREREVANLFHDVSHVADVSGDQEIGASDAPDAELCPVLCICLARAVLHDFPIGTPLQLLQTECLIGYLCIILQNLYQILVDNNCKSGFLS